MVYNGRPSNGCENCRKAKKSCDRVHPVCGRCSRLKKPCGGYRDVSGPIIIDQSTDIVRRHDTGGASSSSLAGPSTRQSATPQREEVARDFFFQHFVTENWLSFLKGMPTDENLMRPILACAFTVLANRDVDDTVARRLAGQYYVSAINGTKQALQDRVMDDTTVVAVFLLGLYESVNWEATQLTVQSWKNHIEGLEMVLRLRGRDQIRSRSGAALFRDVRTQLIQYAIFREETVPDYIVEWSRQLAFDAANNALDTLTLLSARVAEARKWFRTGEKGDDGLIVCLNELEQEHVGWGEATHASGPHNSFHIIHDRTSPFAWQGSRHEYGMANGYRHWNLWRANRLLINQMQVAIWRRSWPRLMQSSQMSRGPDYLRGVRSVMIAEVCTTVAGVFGNDMNAEPPRESVGKAYLVLNILGVAGACLIDGLRGPRSMPTTSGREAFESNVPDQESDQLDWVIQRLDYLSNKVGIRLATVISSFLQSNRTRSPDPNRDPSTGEAPNDLLSYNIFGFSSVFSPGPADQS